MSYQRIAAPGDFLVDITLSIPKVDPIPTDVTIQVVSNLMEDGQFILPISLHDRIAVMLRYDSGSLVLNGVLDTNFDFTIHRPANAPDPFQVDIKIDRGQMTFITAFGTLAVAASGRYNLPMPN